MRSFKNFESIANGDFVAFTEGYHVVTITGHKEDVSKKGQDIDIFELTSDTGATTNLTLYFGEKSLWTYKKLLTIAVSTCLPPARICSTSDFREP